MSNRAMKFAAFGAIAAVALTGCGSSSGSSATSSTSAAAPAATSAAPAAAATSATSAAATSAAVAAATSAATATTAAAATSAAASSGGGATSGFVGVILPDTQSSTRWQDQDLPNLTKAFKDAGIKADIQNAQGSDATFGSIGDAMIAEKVNVLILVGLDFTSAAAVETKAAAAGIKTIDYDRLTLGGSANYYVSYDGVAVGKLQGQGLVGCLKGVTKPSIIEINGSPTDNNATLFAKGYDSVLDPLYASGAAVKGGNKSVPKWDNTQAGVIFQQLLTANGGKVDGVLVANDGMAQSVITRLKSAGIKAPVTGQDATVPGLQSIMAGDQCMTIFKDTSKEAGAVSHLAIELIKGITPTETFVTSDDPIGKRSVKSILLPPESINTSNIEDVIKGGGTTAAAVCTAAFAADCKKYGVS